MKIALVTTTINVPEVLRLYRAQAHDAIAFFVAGDERTPPQAYELCVDIPNCEAYTPERQRELGYACSDLIGWNTIGRRNVATLEALKWGADVIVTVDDDNLPISTDYFDRFEMVLGVPFIGLKFESHHLALRDGDSQRWFDPGQLLQPASSHRGFPPGMPGLTGEIGFAVDAKVGVAAGMCLGDPDISATTRIAAPRQVHAVSELLRAGVVAGSNTWTVFNSQNTAFLRELAPCFLMMPHFQRYDDIFASLVAQRVMREHKLHVHFGQPFVWQQRNLHDLQKDLAAETWGMRHVTDLAATLNAVPLPGKSVLEDVETLWGVLRQPDWMPDGVSALAHAWLRDCARVL